MNDTANQICVAGMSMSLMPGYYKEMERRLSLPLIYGRKDYIHFINILYQMGIDANLRTIPVRKTLAYPAWEDVITHETARLQNREEALGMHRKEIEEILKTYFKQNRDGAYEYTLDIRGALVYWNPKN